MSSIQPLMLKSDRLARAIPQAITFYIHITGAKTNASSALINYPYLLGYDATDLTQTLVEGFLGHTSSAACATIFDATSMGANTIGGVIDMQGQVDKVIAIYAEVYQTAGGTPANSEVFIDGSQVALTSSNTTALATYDGDLYFRLVAGNLDSATAGFIRLKVMFRAK